ncbi:hypothetical protein [Cystobacter ferrugineus]|uniref:Protein kinase n=1 Tax=Cystobacter ferrugineus TaxID=83449 RepID=A0A1L9BDQ1_9BACT|nr:hypothetical protein [Cystobacter ferrugineus]OJH40387.1 hypothetical protein BON30_15290 [Cystobacter ferrugineus]
MDEEEKSQASREEPERLGPYVIQEQVQQSHDSQVELYLATHETSGATALVRKHSSEEVAAAGKDWRVLFGSWAARGYSAMEVERTDWARALDRQSAESLLLTLEGVLEEVRRMARAVADPHEPRLQWSLGRGVAATVCALLLAWVASVSQPPSTPPAPMSDEAPTEAEVPTPFIDRVLADTTPEEPFVLARPLPKEPYKGQKRPPCARYSEVELVGGCWMPHELKAPCPDSLHEYQGKCYVPSFSAKPPPSSLGQ